MIAKWSLRVVHSPNAIAGLAIWVLQNVNQYGLLQPFAAVSVGSLQKTTSIHDTLQMIWDLAL